MSFVGSFSTSGNVTVKADGTQTQIYAEITSVANGSLTTVLTYISATKRLIKQVQVSGSNIATYTLLVNGDIVMKSRTYFGGELNSVMNCDSGIKLAPTDIVTIKVIHERPFVGDFNATLFTEGDST